MTPIQGIDIKNIHEWQALIGSALGPFLAIIFSGVAFWLKSITEERKNRKEALRQVEVDITRSLNDVYVVKDQLKYFIKRAKLLISDIATTGACQFSLEVTNFPSIREIYSKSNMPNLRVKSYYLHNKLLWVEAGIKEINGTVVNFKNDFLEIQRKNELQVILMSQNSKSDPRVQRKDYSNSLESFINAIEEFSEKYIDNIINIMTQVKIYNNHLRNEYLFLWKHEGRSFKFYNSNEAYNKFSKNLDSMNNIDECIKEEVEESLEYAKRKVEALKK